MIQAKRKERDHNADAERALQHIEGGLHDLYEAADRAYAKHEAHQLMVERHRAYAASALDDHIQHVDVADRLMDALPSSPPPQPYEDRTE